MNLLCTMFQGLCRKSSETQSTKCIKSDYSCVLNTEKYPYNNEIHKDKISRNEL